MSGIARMLAVLAAFFALYTFLPEGSDPLRLAAGLPTFSTAVKLALTIGVLLGLGLCALWAVDRGVIQAPGVKRYLITAPRDALHRLLTDPPPGGGSGTGDGVDE